MDAKTTLPLAALCCALALAQPQPAGAQGSGDASAAAPLLAAAAGIPTAPGTASGATPSLAAATLPQGVVRVSCTGCLSRSSSSRTVVVDTARTDEAAGAHGTGNATLRLSGFARDAKGRRLDLELCIDAAATGLDDGAVVIDFTDPGAAGILLGNPECAEGATFTATARLLQTGSGLAARDDVRLAAKRLSPHHGKPLDEEAVASRTAADPAGATTLTWSGGDMFRLVAAVDEDGEEDGNDLAPDPAGTEVLLPEPEDLPGDRADADNDRDDGDDAAADARLEASSTVPDSLEPEAESAPDAAPAPDSADPLAVDASALDPERDCCTALVALDAPQALAASDIPVTSAASRRAASLALPKTFPLTYLPSGEVVAPTLLRIMGASMAWIDIMDIRVENRATDARIRLAARDADGGLEEWFDGDTYLMGTHRLETGEDVDFEVTLEGFSRKTDGDLIEASVYGSQTLFNLVFEYKSLVPTS